MNNCLKILYSVFHLWLGICRCKGLTIGFLTVLGLAPRTPALFKVNCIVCVHISQTLIFLYFFFKLICLNQDLNKVHISGTYALIGAYSQYLPILYFLLSHLPSLSNWLTFFLSFTIYYGTDSKYMRGFGYPKINTDLLY